ncbi:flagellar hook-length control protein FliK [Solibacillus sp. FSL W8-0474]|uniref:flagellar hook-length control protein FliK n=1 Tax=Solibacillus sp. FSL W8-0474 TaxID=2975336 RepID=UPI0030F9CD4A
MNISLLQNIKTKAPKELSQSSVDVKSSKPKGEAFGSVFKSIVTTSEQSAKQTATPKQSLTEDVTTTLEKDSLENLLLDLGVEMDESGLFAFIGEERMPVAVNELLTIDNLTDLLGMTEEQLLQTLQRLMGESQQEITDIWSIIEQAPQILNEVLKALQSIQQGEPSAVQSEELQQVIQLLKLTELAGSKLDTVYRQEDQLAKLKEALLALANEARTLNNSEVSTTRTPFVQVVQQITQQASQQNQQSQQTTVKVDSENQSAVPLQHQAIQTKTVTITLPAEKPAQSEALIKEIQNLINRSQLSGQQGNMKLFLKLFPENLGQIRIEIVQKDGVLTARLLATTPIGKELLENNINQLKAGFVAQNIQMDRIDVAQSLQDADRNTRDQSFFNNFFGKQKEEELEEKEDNSEEETISFKDLLSEEE